MSEYYCENCSYEVNDLDEKCNNCGILFVEKKCKLHTEISADGECLVCGKVCCEKCGLLVEDYFLCEEHSNLEVYERMVKLFSSTDVMQIDFYFNALEQDGFHPFKYSTKLHSAPFSEIGNNIYSCVGETNGKSANEIKLLIPMEEYSDAKKIIEEIRF